MSILVLEMKPGQTLLMEGVRLEFRHKARLEIQDRAAFVFGRQYMSPEEAETSPARAIYYALQMHYAGPHDERRNWGGRLGTLLNSFNIEQHAGLRQEALKMIRNVEHNEFFTALKCARNLVKFEDEATGRIAAEPTPTAPGLSLHATLAGHQLQQ